MRHVALSIRQPWAWLIVNGFKNVENREWPTKFRGNVLIHAGKVMDRDAIEELENAIGYDIPEIELPKTYDLGGIVGRATIVDCVTEMDSPWFTGTYGFVIGEAQRLPFMPCKGQLGFFNIDMTW